MKRYNLVNLPEDCKIVPDSCGDWMRVAEHEVLTVKYRDALEKIAGEMPSIDDTPDTQSRMWAIDRLAKEALGS